jgi:hypothetical protein
MRTIEVESNSIESPAPYEHRGSLRKVHGSNQIREKKESFLQRIASSIAESLADNNENLDASSNEGPKSISKLDVHTMDNYIEKHSRTLKGRRSSGMALVLKLGTGDNQEHVSTPRSIVHDSSINVDESHEKIGQQRATSASTYLADKKKKKIKSNRPISTYS